MARPGEHARTAKPCIAVNPSQVHQGTRTWPNGDRYAGNFKHGMQEGEVGEDMSEVPIAPSDSNIDRAPSKVQRRAGCTAASGSKIECASSAQRASQESGLQRVLRFCLSESFCSKEWAWKGRVMQEAHENKLRGATAPLPLYKPGNLASLFISGSLYGLRLHMTDVIR